MKASNYNLTGKEVRTWCQVQLGLKILDLPIQSLCNLRQVSASVFSLQNGDTDAFLKELL